MAGLSSRFSPGRKNKNPMIANDNGMIIVMYHCKSLKFDKDEAYIFSNNSIPF